MRGVPLIPPRRGDPLPVAMATIPIQVCEHVAKKKERERETRMSRREVELCFSRRMSTVFRESNSVRQYKETKFQGSVLFCVVVLLVFDMYYHFHG